MASNHSVELDSGATDSVNSTPRSGQISKWNEEGQPRIRFMCSFGGRIVPRPHDNQLRYVGGDTRIVATHRTCTFASLVSKLSKLTGDSDFTVKYQLPNEDLDALISVTTDEDLDNMLEEYDRLAQSGGGNNSKTARLRLFLFSQASSRSSSIASLLDGGAGGAKQWFLDALNGGSASLERGRSEVSSIVSEVPDYLFGLDMESDTAKTRFNPHLPSENVSVVSDPGSPALQVSASPYCSTSSAAGVPAGLAPVKTKPESPALVEEAKGNQTEPEAAAFQKQTGYVGGPAWHYVADPHLQGQPMQPMPVYYMSPGNVPVRPVPVQMPTYVQRIPMPAPAPAQPYHNPMIANQVAGGQMYGQVPQVLRPAELKPVPAPETYELPMGVIGEGGQVLYGQRNPGVIPAYPPAGVPVAGEIHVTSSDYALNDR